MLDYAVKVTVAPARVGASDLEALRESGFDDAAILDVCQVACYYNYVNRLADGLGVELESRWEPEDLTLTRAEFDRRREP
jgi:alkylhydroperoxidase family enzyme